MNTTRLIVGCGYVGERLAKRWIHAGDNVFAITRNPSRILELQRLGVRPILWNWYDAHLRNDSEWFELIQAEPRTLQVLISVSHASVPALPYKKTHVAGLVNLFSQLELGFKNLSPIRIIYLSTTGVYGPGADAVEVDEQTIPNPDRPGSIAALHAEKWLLNSQISNTTILRPAGIYGPNRLPNWQALQGKIPIVADPDSYLNLIHIDDLVLTVDAMANRKMLQKIYCVCDNEPVTRRAYYHELAEIGGWPAPVFETVDKSLEQTHATTRRTAGNKRVINRRMVNELGWIFRYPTYREGLRALFDGNAGCSQTPLP